MGGVCVQERADILCIILFGFIHLKGDGVTGEERESKGIVYSHTSTSC